MSQLNNKEDKGRDLVKDALEILPENIRESIYRRINDVISYEPVIGIMGKTGAGKSSLCNAIFKGDVCAVSDVEACTREMQEIRIQFGTRSVRLIDIPGVAGVDTAVSDIATCQCAPDDAASCRFIHRATNNIVGEAFSQTEQRPVHRQPGNEREQHKASLSVRGNGDGEDIHRAVRHKIILPERPELAQIAVYRQLPDKAVPGIALRPADIEFLCQFGPDTALPAEVGEVIQLPYFRLLAADEANFYRMPAAAFGAVLQVTKVQHDILTSVRQCR